MITHDEPRPSPAPYDPPHNVMILVQVAPYAHSHVFSFGVLGGFRIAIQAETREVSEGIVKAMAEGGLGATILPLFALSRIQHLEPAYLACVPSSKIRTTILLPYQV